MSLRDTSLADAPSRILSESNFVMTSVDSADVPFTLELPAERRQAGRRWTFDATVTRSLQGQTAPGDCVLSRATEYQADGRQVSLTLQMIS